MKFHPLANLFPLLDDASLGVLASDVSENGLLEPITRFEGMILDGRNRFKACERAKVQPIFEDYKGADPVAFVIAKNLHRRQLSVSARAMTAARLATLQPGGWRGHPGKSNAPQDALPQAAAAKLFGVSRRTVQRAGVVQEKGIAPLVTAVEQEKVPVTIAARVAEHPADEQQSWFANPKKQEKKWRAKAARAKAAREDDDPFDEAAAQESFCNRARAVARAARYPDGRAVTAEMRTLAEAAASAWLKLAADIGARVEPHVSIVPDSTDDEPGDDAQTIWARGVLARADEATSLADLGQLEGFVAEGRHIEAARRVVNSWEKAAQQLEKLHVRMRRAKP